MAALIQIRGLQDANDDLKKYWMAYLENKKANLKTTSEF